jgi:phage minor structural protein
MDFSYVNDVDTLLMYGKLYLPTVSYPPTTYQLEAALLNEVHANFSDDEVDIGDIVSVIHEDLDITVSTRILKIVQPWLDIAPAEATMEISTQIKTLADAFRTLWNKV